MTRTSQFESKAYISPWATFLRRSPSPWGRTNISAVRSSIGGRSPGRDGGTYQRERQHGRFSIKSLYWVNHHLARYTGCLCDLYRRWLCKSSMTWLLVTLKFSRVNILTSFKAFCSEATPSQLLVSTIHKTSWKKTHTLVNNSAPCKRYIPLLRQDQ